MSGVQGWRPVDPRKKAALRYSDAEWETHREEILGHLENMTMQELITCYDQIACRVKKWRAQVIVPLVNQERIEVSATGGSGCTLSQQVSCLAPTALTSKTTKFSAALAAQGLSDTESLASPEQSRLSVLATICHQVSNKDILPCPGDDNFQTFMDPVNTPTYIEVARPTKDTTYAAAVGPKHSLQSLDLQQSGSRPETILIKLMTLVITHPDDRDDESDAYTRIESHGTTADTWSIGSLYHARVGRGSLKMLSRSVTIMCRSGMVTDAVDLIKSLLLESGAFPRETWGLAAIKVEVSRRLQQSETAGRPSVISVDAVLQTMFDSTIDRHLYNRRVLDERSKPTFESRSDFVERLMQGIEIQRLFRKAPNVSPWAQSLRGLLVTISQHLSGSGIVADTWDELYSGLLSSWEEFDETQTFETYRLCLYWTLLWTPSLVGIRYDISQMSVNVSMTMEDTTAMVAFLVTAADTWGGRSNSLWELLSYNSSYALNTVRTGINTVVDLDEDALRDRVWAGYVYYTCLDEATHGLKLPDSFVQHRKELVELHIKNQIQLEITSHAPPADYVTNSGSTVHDLRPLDPPVGSSSRLFYYAAHPFCQPVLTLHRAFENTRSSRISHMSWSTTSSMRSFRGYAKRLKQDQEWEQIKDERAAFVWDQW